jgi:hypothetical protein
MASRNCFGKNVCNDLNVCIPVQNNQTMPLPKPVSSMQWGVPSKVQELLDKVNEIFFERDNIEYLILSPTINDKK